jgi:hypothetical protein
MKKKKKKKKIKKKKKKKKEKNKGKQKQKKKFKPKKKKKKKKTPLLHSDLPLINPNKPPPATPFLCLPVLTKFFPDPRPPTRAPPHQIKLLP